MSRAPRAVGLLIVLCAALVAGTLVVGQLLPDVPFDDTTPVPRRDTLTAVTWATTALDSNADLHVEWTPATQWTTSVSSTGLVTAIWVEPGDTVRCGQPIVSVDGHPVIAWCGRSPLWRPLPTSPGTDTDDLIAALTALGHLSTATPGRTELRNAVRSLQRQLGLTDDGVLDPAETIWIGPVAEVLVDDVVSVGTPVGAATPVLTRDAHLASARVSGEVASEGAWRFQPAVDPSTTIDLAPGGHVAGSHLADLEHMIIRTLTTSELPADIAGVLQRTAPIEAAVVPASAIVLDPLTGVRCLYTSEGSPVVVELVRSGPDATLVLGDLRAGELIHTLGPSDRCST